MVHKILRKSACSFRNHHLDLRYDFLIIIYLLFPWTQHFLRIGGGGSGGGTPPHGSPHGVMVRECEQQLEELYGVLEAMLGLRSFEDWNKNGDLTASRMGPVPRSLYQLLTYFPNGHTKLSRVRTNEFFFSKRRERLHAH